MIIDASGAVLGRLASFAAKRLVSGEDVIVVNAEKAVISGGRAATLERYKVKFNRLSKGTPTEGPKFYRRPDMLVKRTIRGMVGFTRPRGELAFKRLRVFMGVPKEYADKVEKADVRAPRAETMTIEELCRTMGWKNRLE
jgi:large subunit ribosomal protein L13